MTLYQPSLRASTGFIRDDDPVIVRYVKDLPDVALVRAVPQNLDKLWSVWVLSSSIHADTKYQPEGC